MKYIKAYKIFENNEDKAEYIEDIFLELIDDGFKVNFKKRTNKEPESKYLEIVITNNFDLIDKFKL